MNFNALLASVICMALFSCSNDAPTESKAPPTPVHVQDNLIPISANEAERGRQACDAYVERLCKCSETHADLEKKCELVKATPGALTLNLRQANAEGNLERRDRVAVIHSARQIIRKCIEAEVRLDDEKCPRPSKSATPASP